MTRIPKQQKLMKPEKIEKIYDGKLDVFFMKGLFSGVYFHIIFTLLIYNFINCFKTEKGDKLAGIGLIRLHDEISWYGVVIYAGQVPKCL